MSETLTTKDVKKGEFGHVSEGDKQSAERSEHRAGVLEAVACYCGQRAGHSRIRRCVLGKGVLQRWKRRRKGLKNTVKRQVFDKDIEKVALLTPEQGKQTDNVSVGADYGRNN